MKKVNLFIAMSLDGFIADAQGGVDWLAGHGNDDETIDAYSEFIKDIDTILMGQNTYHQIVTELSLNKWVYEEFETYVITHEKKAALPKIQFTDENPVDLVAKLRQENGKGIWICGGANLAQQLIAADVIDRYYITVIPTILESGIRLFGNTDCELKLRLLKTRAYNGMVDLIYERR